MRKYVVTSANANVIYRLTEFDEITLVISIGGKRVRIFKMQHDDKPNLCDLDEEENEGKQATGHEVNEWEEKDY